MLFNPELRTMVRINLISPKFLADQHLIAEYDEILMLLGYVRRYPIVKYSPKEYTLGKGHMLFFKDKLLYLKKRHEALKREMSKRSFKAKITINLKDYPKNLQGDYKPTKEAKEIIKQRIIDKLNKKPDFYRYNHEYKNKEFFINLIKKS